MNIVPAPAPKECSLCHQAKPFSSYTPGKKGYTSNRCDECRATSLTERIEAYHARRVYEQSHPLTAFQSIEKVRQAEAELIADVSPAERPAWQTRRDMKRANKRLNEAIPAATTFLKTLAEVAGQETNPFFLSSFNFFQRGRPEWLTETAHQRRRFLIAHAGPRYTAAEWQSLCDIVGHRCLWCGKTEPLTVDHIIPLSKGGRNHIENCQPLCRPCNSKKATKTMDFRPHALRQH